MTTSDGKMICDKEVGHWKRGWHSCKRKAHFSVPSKHCAALTLHYCKRHAPVGSTKFG